MHEAPRRGPGRPPIRPRPDNPNLDEMAAGLAPAGLSPMSTPDFGSETSFDAPTAALGAETEFDQDLDFQSFADYVLPKPTPITGYHLAWLSTTNAAAPLSRYLQKPFSYTIVTEDDYPGVTGYARFWNNKAVKDGDLPGGAITCNEMVLCKVPVEHYRKIMMHYHHRAPASFEDGLDAQRKTISANLRGRKHVPDEDMGESLHVNARGQQRYKDGVIDGHIFRRATFPE